VLLKCDGIASSQCDLALELTGDDGDSLVQDGSNGWSVVCGMLHEGKLGPEQV